MANELPYWAEGTFIGNFHIVLAEKKLPVRNIRLSTHDTGRILAHYVGSDGVPIVFRHAGKQGKRLRFNILTAGFNFHGGINSSNVLWLETDHLSPFQFEVLVATPTSLRGHLYAADGRRIGTEKLVLGAHHKRSEFHLMKIGATPCEFVIDRR
ncbi:hypothetical protein [Pseudomonas sp. PSKL.D1]|uniref:hypothetical protein n=1 Tax=Pseudomonas sp. PSKL.D1 TaxID=3029060 RepID=UPI002380F79F|nr:hypothetical protein [Pseudomonas sp. PSKL.D1]WDY55717.1 hypothetical protein PVV54_13950 [Pseudomonas sp. PSKL.D1]